MELNKEVDVAILPKLALKSGTEEGEFPYPISFAEIGNLVTWELNIAFRVHFKPILLRSGLGLDSSRRPRQRNADALHSLPLLRTLILPFPKPPCDSR
jgi:hypothetical protein